MPTPVFQFSVGILIQPSILHLIYVGSALPPSILFVEWQRKIFINHNLKSYVC